MRGTEAQLAKIKLESEGIPCFVADEFMHLNSPFVISEVQLQVPQDMLERANAILDAPPADAKPEDYVEETWRCPACHRRKVDLLPLPAGWQVVKYLAILMIAAPFLVELAKWAVPIPAFVRFVEGTTEQWLCMWLALTAALGAAVILAKRRKRCQDCGHAWS